MQLRRVTPATLLGKGKVEEIHKLCHDLYVDVVVDDDALTPVQQRNLEKAWEVRSHRPHRPDPGDFSPAAPRTREGRLQVELARLSYERSRLVRTWTHLERQRGGFGVMGGPGETQIETDRRLIAEKIGKLKRELAEVRRTRTLQRSGAPAASLSDGRLVGYTNAGKSTLFNRLTKAEVMAEDMLFATLDPTLRMLSLPDGPPGDPVRYRGLHLRPAATNWSRRSAPPLRRSRKPTWCCTCATIASDESDAQAGGRARGPGAAGRGDGDPPGHPRSGTRPIWWTPTAARHCSATPAARGLPPSWSRP